MKYLGKVDDQINYTTQTRNKLIVSNLNKSLKIFDLSLNDLYKTYLTESHIEYVKLNGKFFITGFIILLI